MKLKYTPITAKEEMDKIHEATIKILTTVGFVYESQEAIDLLKSKGVKVDGKTAFYTRKQIEEAIDTVPKTFEWYGRGRSVTVGEGAPVNMATVGPMYALEGVEYRLANMQDFINFMILHSTSDVMDVCNPNMMTPQGTSEEISQECKMALTLMHTDKPVFGSKGSRAEVEKSFETIKAFNDITDDQKVYAYTVISTASPLRLTSEMCDTQIATSQAGQIVRIGGGGMTGMTSPHSFGGNMLQGNVEKIAGVTFSQIINPGCPCFISATSILGDIKNMSSIIGSPELSLASYFAKDMSGYYGIPTTGSGCISDAKQVDYQAGAESFMQMFSYLYAEHETVAMLCGILDSYNSISYEKFVLDEEVVRTINRVLRGYEFTEEKLHVDKILKAGPNGNYLGRTHKDYREDFYEPKLFNRQNHGDWIKEGSQTINFKASIEYKKRIEQFKLSKFDKIQQKIIKENVPPSILDGLNWK